MTDGGLVMTSLEVGPDVAERGLSQERIRRAGTIRLGVDPAAITIAAPSMTDRVMVRTLDLIVASIGLVLAAPLMLLVAAVVRCTSRGPVLFAATRMGRGHRTIKMWKFRTMVCDADAELNAHLAADPNARREWARNHKLVDDPRLTRVGRLLRRSSLDELPQLVNVLRGEMSIIGPRPLTLDEYETYTTFASQIANVRGGLTGPWQVGGRNFLTFDERIPLDIAYVRNRSIGSDIGILFRTVAHLLKGSPGAF